jgi:hypothetical protein
MRQHPAPLIRRHTVFSTFIGDGVASRKKKFCWNAPAVGASAADGVALDEQYRTEAPIDRSKRRGCPGRPAADDDTLL